MNAKMRKPLVYTFYCLVTVAMIVCGGCSHKMEITNTEDYFSPPSTVSKQSFKLGVTSSSVNHPQNSKYVAAVVDSLQKNNSIERVIYPYNQATHQDMVDAVVDISIKTHYDGKGSNFWVNWPGFIIFAPAVWGYGYTADIETQAVVTSIKGGTKRQIAIPTKYEFRHADMGRTWTEVGWLEVGIIPLIGGFVFTGYDDDITGDFIKEVAPNYGPFVSTKIVETACDCLGYR